MAPLRIYENRDDEGLTVPDDLSHEPLWRAGPEDGAEPVPQAVSILDIRKSITFCRQVSMPIAGVIENMSGLDCPHCGKRIELFRSGGGRKAAEDMGVTFLGALPIDPDVVSSGDEGRPYVATHHDSSLAREFETIVNRLLDGKP